jgi:hypothetical protein
MVKSIRWAILILCCSVLCACATPEDQTDTPQTPRQKQTHIFNDQTQALDKAKNLSRTLHQGENARQRQFQEESTK